MEKLLYDDKLKINIPDNFVEIKWNEYEKYFGDGPIDYGFIDEKINSSLCFYLRQESSLKSTDVVTRMGALKTGYAAINIPGYRENECLTKDFENHTLGLLTFTSTGDNNTNFYLVSLTNFDDKELIITFNCNMKNMPFLLSKIVRMLEEMEF